MIEHGRVANIKIAEALGLDPNSVVSLTLRASYDSFAELECVLLLRDEQTTQLAQVLRNYSLTPKPEV